MSDDLLAMIERLERKFAGAPPHHLTKALPREWTTAEIAEAVRKRRSELGLPVAAVDRLLQERWVPAMFWPVVAKVQKTDAVKLVERLLAGEGLILLLAGDTGRGKSCAAAFALARWPGIWVHAPDLARIPVAGDLGPDIDARMRTKPLLVLDEVGLEHSPGGYAASRICAAITARHAARRPTIITTNLAAEQFKARYGDRIGSRLDGDGLGWQTVAGPDLRVNSHWSEAYEKVDE